MSSASLRVQRGEVGQYRDRNTDAILGRDLLRSLTGTLPHAGLVRETDGMRKLLGRQCIDGYSRGGDPELLKTPSPEELVGKERNDNGRYSRPQSGSCRTRAAMVHSKRHLLEQPIVRDFSGDKDLVVRPTGHFSHAVPTSRQNRPTPACSNCIENRAGCSLRISRWHA